MDDRCSELKQLNRATFDAEAKKDVGDETWDQILQRVLTDDFIIRRSNPAIPNQGRSDMLEHIRKGPIAERTLLADEVKAWCDETTGIVICPVTMVRDDQKLHRYENIKVFTRRPGSPWQCIFWHVAEAPAG